LLFAVIFIKSNGPALKAEAVLQLVSQENSSWPIKNSDVVGSFQIALVVEIFKEIPTIYCYSNAVDLELPSNKAEICLW